MCNITKQFRIFTFGLGTLNLKHFLVLLYLIITNPEIRCTNFKALFDVFVSNHNQFYFGGFTVSMAGRCHEALESFHEDL